MPDLERDLTRLAPSEDGVQPSLSRALQAVSSRAGEEGLIDVAYALVDSPLGPLVAAVTSNGLARLAYEDGRLDAVLAELARRISPRVLEAPRRLDEPRRQLDEYFSGRRREFTLPIDLALTRGFTRDVLRVTSEIPFGEASTYLEVAARTGRPRAVRATGNALGANPIPIVVPCHRVLRTGGGLGGYTGGLERKRLLLELERPADLRVGFTAP